MADVSRRDVLGAAMSLPILGLSPATLGRKADFAQRATASCRRAFPHLVQYERLWRIIPQSLITSRAA